MKKHRFWDRQPVDVNDGNEMIQEPSGVSVAPLRLPDGFSFESLSDVEELARFLKNNYVEDVHEGHVLTYSSKILKWMFECGGPNEYKLVLRWNGEMVGFAFAKEHKLVVRKVKERVVSVNLLCVSRSLRGRRFAPVIIKEITRRVNLNGIYRAIFTSGTELFFNISSCDYYHKPLNPDRLFRSGFCDRIMEVEVPKPRDSTRLATRDDLEDVARLLNEEADKYAFHEEMDVEGVSHALLPYDEVVYTYVHEVEGKITEFGSFFVLDTIEKRSGERVRGGYLYYRTGGKLKEIVSDLVYFAKTKGCDVFNCLDIMGNAVFLDELGFERGTGSLKYYLYNWRSQKVDPSEVFFVLH